MQHRSRQWIISLVILVCSQTFICMAEPCEEEQKLPSMILSSINQHREALKLKPFLPNPSVAEVAQEYAHSIQEHGFTHLDTDGSSSLIRVIRRGIPAIMVGENLAEASTDFSQDQLCRELLGKFLASPSHRENITSLDYNEVGICAYKKGALYHIVIVFVQMPSQETPGSIQTED